MSETVYIPQTSEVCDGFKETEIGPIPAEWEVVRLGEIADYINGYAFKPTQWTDRGLPIIRIQNLTGTSSRYNYFDGQVKERYRVRNGDLLISWSASLGVFLWQGGDAWLNQHIFKVDNIATNVSKLFLFFVLQHFLSSITDKTRGTTMKHITRKEFLAVPIPLPPLPEQRRIAHILRTIQRAIEATDAVIAAARELKRSLMQRLFTYGPGPEPAPTKQTEIGEIPAHWEVVQLNDLFEIRQGKALSRKRQQGLARYYFLRTANVRWGKIDLSFVDEMGFTSEEVNKFALKPGDLLVCEGGEIGRTALWREEGGTYCYQNHLHRLRTTRQDICPLFYMYWMQTAFLLRNVYHGIGVQTTISNLSRARLSRFLFLKPPLPEQRFIARLLYTVDHKIDAEEQRKAALQALFKSMLHRLMTGQVRV